MNLLLFLEIKVPIRLKNDYRWWSDRAGLSLASLEAALIKQQENACLSTENSVL